MRTFWAENLSYATYFLNIFYIIISFCFFLSFPFPFPDIPKNESLWFPFPNCGNGFFHSLPIPELWEWIFPFPSCSRISGMVFFYSLPIPELWEWMFHSLPVPKVAISQSGIKIKILRRLAARRPSIFKLSIKSWFFLSKNTFLWQIDFWLVIQKRSNNRLRN